MTNLTTPANAHCVEDMDDVPEIPPNPSERTQNYFQVLLNYYDCNKDFPILDIIKNLV